MRKSEREMFEEALERKYPGWDSAWNGKDRGYDVAWVDGAWCGWQLAKLEQEDIK
jgi:hypothetical protein